MELTQEQRTELANAFLTKQEAFDEKREAFEKELESLNDDMWNALAVAFGYENIEAVHDSGMAITVTKKGTPTVELLTKEESLERRMMDDPMAALAALIK